MSIDTEGIVCHVGPNGAMVNQDVMQKVLGTKRKLVAILNLMIIKEKRGPAKQKGFGLKIIKGYRFATIDSIKYVTIPIPIAHKLSEHGIIQKLIFDEVPEPVVIPEERKESTEEFYDYQHTVIDYFSSETSPIHKNGRLYLEMNTGLGKTRVACGIIHRMGLSALIIVPTLAIREQWLEEIKTVLPKIKCGAYTNSDKQPMDANTHDIVIGIVNTIRNKTSEFFDGYGVVVIDEAHEYHSDKNSNILHLARNKFVIGLSATPNENPNGLDRLVNLFLNDPINVETIPGFNLDADNFQVRVRQVQYANDPEYCEVITNGAGMVSAILSIERFIQDPARLQMLTNETFRLFNLHESDEAEAYGLVDGATHGIFIFAELRSFLTVIYDALLELFSEDDIDAPEITILKGGAKKTEMLKAKKSRIVLTTYGYSRRGVSLTEMTSILLATPRRNGLKQIIGRVLRKGGNETIVREIVDVVDTRTCLRSQFNDHKKIYESRNYPINVVHL